MDIECPESVITAISLLEKSGFEAYTVGGCVRDAIMGKAPHDWDMTTSSAPEQTMEVFKGYRTIPTGIKHGTVTVIINREPIEITTMRIDGEYIDCRHPETVQYTDRIKDDLSRRDFTANAMAYNPKFGVVDPYGGESDIKNKLIKCVGDPDKRFNEDALRIIRALRFSSVLDFEIEQSTEESILRNGFLLENIASERIRVELIKLLQGKGVENVLSRFKDIIFIIIPELKTLDGFEQMTNYHIYDIWTHTVKVVANVKNTPELRVAALLHDIGKPEKFTIDSNGTGHFKGHPAVSKEISEVVLKRLRFSNIEIEKITKAIELHDMRPDGTKRQLIKWCAKYGIENIENALEIMEADAAAQNPEYYNQRMRLYELTAKQLNEIRCEAPCLKLKDLKINGNDLIALGFRGESIGYTLEQLLSDVIEGTIKNEKGLLIAKAKEII